MLMSRFVYVASIFMVVIEMSFRGGFYLVAQQPAYASPLSDPISSAIEEEELTPPASKEPLISNPIQVPPSLPEEVLITPSSSGRPWLNFELLPVAEPAGGSLSPSTVSWGPVEPGQVKTAVMRLTVRTNAPDGFVLYVRQNHNMIHHDNTTIDIDGVANVLQGTNNAPVQWASPQGVAAGVQSGHLGYTTTDTTLNNVGEGINRFYSGNRYASLTSLSEEILYHDAPVDGQVEGEGFTDLLLRLEINEHQPNGAYSNQLTFVAKPLF